jgi:hypothetical protein
MVFALIGSYQGDVAGPNPSANSAVSIQGGIGQIRTVKVSKSSHHRALQKDSSSRLMWHLTMSKPVMDAPPCLEKALSHLHWGSRRRVAIARLLPSPMDANWQWRTFRHHRQF